MVVVRERRIRSVDLHWHLHPLNCWREETRKCMRFSTHSMGWNVWYVIQDSLSLGVILNPTNRNIKWTMNLHHVRKIGKTNKRSSRIGLMKPFLALLYNLKLSLHPKPMQKMYQFCLRSLYYLFVLSDLGWWQLLLFVISQKEQVCKAMIDSFNILYSPNYKSVRPVRVLTYTSGDAWPPLCPCDHREGCDGSGGGGRGSSRRRASSGRVGTAHAHGTRVLAQLVCQEVVDGTVVVETVGVYRLARGDNKKTIKSLLEKVSEVKFVFYCMRTA